MTTAAPSADVMALEERAAYLQGEREAITATLEILTAGGVRASLIAADGESDGSTIGTAAAAHVLGLDPDSERDLAAAVEEARRLRARRSEIVRELALIGDDLRIASGRSPLRPSMAIAVSGGRSIRVAPEPEPIAAPVMLAPAAEPVAVAAETAATVAEPLTRPVSRAPRYVPPRPRERARRPRFAPVAVAPVAPIAEPVVAAEPRRAMRGPQGSRAWRVAVRVCRAWVRLVDSIDQWQRGSVAPALAAQTQ